MRNHWSGKVVEKSYVVIQARRVYPQLMPNPGQILGRTEYFGRNHPNFGPKRMMPKPEYGPEPLPECPHTDLQLTNKTLETARFECFNCGYVQYDAYSYE